MNHVLVDGAIAWVFTHADGRWSGLCETLGLTCAGETFGELLTSAHGAMALLFDQWHRSGTLLEHGTMHGLRFVGTLDPPVIFDVPYTHTVVWT